MLRVLLDDADDNDNDGIFSVFSQHFLQFLFVFAFITYKVNNVYKTLKIYANRENTL